MIALVQQAKLVQDFLEERGWPFCIIGGLALVRWGQARVTKDVDITLFAGFGGEEPIVDTLLGKFPSRTTDARRFALARRVLLLTTPTGSGLDISLGGLPYERDVVMRSSKSEYQPGLALRTCSAEDLIVLKAFAARPQDWVDVANVAVRQTGHLDWPAIYQRLTPLVDLKEEPEILTRLRAIESDATS